MLHRDKLNSGELQDYASGLAIGKYKGLADRGPRRRRRRLSLRYHALSRAAFLRFGALQPADADPGELVNQVADIFLAKEIKAAAPAVSKEPAKTDAATSAPMPLTAEQMAAIAGMYWNRDGDNLRKCR